MREPVEEKILDTLLASSRDEGSGDKDKGQDITYTPIGYVCQG